jgi:hypothetical protein
MNPRDRTLGDKEEEAQDASPILGQGSRISPMKEGVLEGKGGGVRSGSRHGGQESVARRHIVGPAEGSEKQGHGRFCGEEEGPLGSGHNPLEIRI